MSPRTTFLIKLSSISSAIIAGILIILLFIHSTVPDNQPEQPQQNFSAFKVPNEIDFCGEKVPVERDDVLESLDREIQVNAYWHSQTLLFMKRSTRYFPIIEPILQSEGVPDDFKYLAVIESSLMPRAQSPAGAVGIWQFMPETGKSFGLEVSKEVDERYNVEKSTIAACRYLKAAKQKLGSWTLAAASYNGGIAGVNKQQEIQKETNYHELLFGDETGRYVYRIIAVKEIMKNPSKYGFNLSEDDYYSPFEYQTIEVSDAIADFADFAKQNNTSYKTLKNLNPWLRDTKLTNIAKKTYQIKVPAN